MADQNARQDENQFPALIAHTGTAGTSEVVRVVADSAGNLGVNVVTGEIVASLGTVGTIQNLNQGTITVLAKGTISAGTVQVSAGTIASVGTVPGIGTITNIGTVGGFASGAALGIQMIDGTVNLVKDGTIGVPQYAMQVDESGAGTTLVGEAAIGSATSGACWRIKRIVDTGGAGTETVITWADSNGSFDNIWTARGTMTFG